MIHSHSPGVHLKPLDEATQELCDNVPLFSQLKPSTAVCRLQIKCILCDLVIWAIGINGTCLGKKIEGKTISCISSHWMEVTNCNKRHCCDAVASCAMFCLPAFRGYLYVTVRDKREEWCLTPYPFLLPPLEQWLVWLCSVNSNHDDVAD